MFNQDSNLRSKICNTDIYGLRFNNSRDLKEKKSILSLSKNKKQNGILLGNSMAFGEGATKDEKTITSQLTKMSKYNFLNFCGRGFFWHARNH